MSRFDHSGMVDVTKEAFYGWITGPANTPQIDVMPSVQESRDYTVWKSLKTGAVYGVSYPGWGAEGPDRYALRRDLITKGGAR